MGELPRQPTQEGESIVGINETPAVRYGDIELAIVAQAATDLSQMRVLLSARKMLDDRLDMMKSKRPSQNGSLVPSISVSRYSELTRSAPATSTAKVPDSPNPSLEK